MGLEGRRVLFISYNGMLDPLGQTQVLPYLRTLTQKGVQYTLLSFERPKAYERDGVEKCEALQTKLSAEGIDWHRLPYHQRPSLPATAYDVLAGIRYARKLVRNNKIELIHARSHIPATIALSLKKQLGIKMIFDLRGLMAEEYVDAGHWKKGSTAYRITKTAERRIFAGTDAIVTLTERIWPIIKDWDGLRGRTIHHAVIPCCADLTLFKFNSDDRSRIRTELNLGDRFTFVYSGSLDGWYLTEEMADFFGYVLGQRSKAHMLWLTNGKPQRVKELMSARGISEDSYSVRSVAAATVPSYLSAGDIGLAFIKQCFSKLASSPTKNGEYLACGLPLLLNSGVGDSDQLIKEWKAGVLVDNFTRDEYSRALRQIEAIACDPEAKTEARNVAERLFDLESIGGERYADLYERVLDVQ